MAYWSRLVVRKCARFVKFKNITICIEANKCLLLLLLLSMNLYVTIILLCLIILALNIKNQLHVFKQMHKTLSIKNC